MINTKLTSALKFIALTFLSLIITASKDSKLLFNEDEPRFYLSNYTSFAPGDDVRVNLNIYSRSDYRISCKLLKISNVEEFFKNLDENRRSYNFDVWDNKNEPLLKYTKLAREWKTKHQSGNYYDNLKVGKIEESGIYLLQVLIGKNVAYCPIVVTDKAIILKTSGNKMLAYLANAESGEFINDVVFKLYKGSKLLLKGSPDKSGIFYKDIKSADSEQKSLLIFAATEDETIVYNPYYYFGNQYSKKVLAYIYTNQPVYRPSQEVNFKAILREVEINQLENLPEKNVNVSIKSPKNKEVYSKQLKTNEFGTISDKFILDEEADLGDYSIIITLDEQQFYGSFSVEEYKKPEYKVNIELDKKQYSAGDEISGAISADYYFGSPVQNASVEVNIYRETFWRPWWYFSEYRWFYGGFEKMNLYYQNKELIQQITGELGTDGKFHFSYPIEEKIENDFRYSVIAIVTDASRRATENSAEFFVTRGLFSLSTSPEKYFFESDSKVKIRVNAFDFSDSPVKTDFRLVITYPDDKLMRPGNLTDTIYGRTNERGNSLIEFSPKWNLTGHYKYSVIAYDEKGREISASSSFYIGNYKDYYYNRTSFGIEIVTDKDAYDKGEMFNAFVFIPFESQELLITYEADEIFDYKKIKVENNSFQIKEKLTDKFSPSFNLTVNFIRNRMLYTSSKLIGVLPKEKFLNMELLSSKEIYKPGEKASYKILVKDYKGNPIPNTELSIGIVDESIYAIKEDQTTPIENFFYSPRYSYIPIYNSLQGYRFSTTSRNATFLEVNYFDSQGKSLDEPTSIKSYRLFGRVTFENSSANYSDYKISLIGKKRKYESEIDSSGNYHLKDVKEGTYQIYIARKGGGMHLVDIVNLTADKRYDIKLESYVIESLDEIVVFGNRPLEERATTNALKMTVAELSVQDRSISPGVLSDGVEEKQKSEFVPAEIRSNFVDALIWKAQLVTDSEGKASIEFKIPDNLTTWRTTIKGITKNSEVGQKTHKFISRKNLLVRMETPRFMRDGDEVIISTIVHNYLSDAKKTKIDFSTDKLELIESRINSKWYGSNFSNRKNYEVEIPANSELRIDWKCKVNYPTGEAVLKVQALTNEESDALEIKVPILPNGVKVVNPLVANYYENKLDEILELNIPSNIDLRTLKFSFSVSPSLAGTLLKALDDLAGYPYGCVEQTMSRFLPTVIVANTFKEISVPLKSKTIEELPKYVEAGLKRLYSFQHSDGGWGWWTNDNTNPFMTAYVIYGLTLAQQAGYEIDKNIFESGLRNLRTQIEKANPEIDETTLAYMLYSLSYALKNYDYQKTLYYQTIDILLKRDLSSYPLALLSLALNNFGEKEKSLKVAEKLLGMVKEESGFAYWGGESWHYRWQNDNVQGTAFAVKAIINVKGDNEIISKAIRWLLKKRQGFSWRSTQETANVVFALTDYLKVTKELNPDYNLKVYLNDKEVLSKKYSADDIYSEVEVIKIEGSKDNLLRSNSNRIRIVKSGNGKVYFSAVTEYFTTDLNSISKENGFKIRREYYLLEPKEKDGKIIYTKEKFNGKIQSGKELFVKTFVENNSSEMEYFILEDMLPSGFEVVKDIDRYSIDGENDYPVYDFWGYRPWRWHYADREYRDEKVAFFVTNCSNKMEFSYIIKAQIPGEYKIMPSQGYLMYYPEMNGFSDVVSVRVLDSE
ncbi:MAG: MG2 domain-containing protein [Ignavibacterium sp.]